VGLVLVRTFWFDGAIPDKKRTVKVILIIIFSHFLVIINRRQLFFYGNEFESSGDKTEQLEQIDYQACTKQRF
jgi:hypothetical protein